MNGEFDYFKTVSKDSMSWLDNSEKLKTSADVIHKELKPLVESFLRGNYEDEDKIQALWNSYLMLAGFAFENIIKGLSIEKNRAKSFVEIFKDWQKKNSGHGLSKMIRDNLSNLADEEFKILERLETYTMWAGKYPLPKKPDDLATEREKLFYHSKDYENINLLFNKIKKVLINDRESNGNYPSSKYGEE